MLPRVIPGLVSAPALRKLFARALLALLPFAALSLPSMQAFAAPQVATSIKPLQLIAAAITDGVSTPAVVWGQGQDPHHVSLRPSERRLVSDADVVLWIGPMLERPLASLVDDLAARVVTVQQLSGLELITVEGQPDPHVWIDTRNARLIATTLANMLVELDAANAERYGSNLARFTSGLDTLAAEITQGFHGADARAWSVYHHALRYLEREFKLPAPVLLADSENNSPGIRTARQVRAELAQEGITCMLIEPGVNRDEIATMLDLPTLQLVEADIMGRGAAAGDYISYLRTLTMTVRACVGMAP